MIVGLTVGLAVAVYGLVRFGYGPEARHSADARPRTSAASARKPHTIPAFPLPNGTVGMAINPPYKTSLPPVVETLGKNPGIVESYLSFGGTFPLASALHVTASHRTADQALGQILTVAGLGQIAGPLVAPSGAHDLCMTFTQNGPDPFWVLDRLTLRP